MARAQTMVQLTEELVAALDAEAARQGVSRSAVLREAAAEYLTSTRRTKLDRLIVEGYERQPQGVPDHWGDLERLADRRRQETLERIAAEEPEGWS
ncbi:MAG: CopG family transcriptional regulator [Actinomycetota bacterium]